MKWIYKDQEVNTGIESNKKQIEEKYNATLTTTLRFPFDSSLRLKVSDQTREDKNQDFLDNPVVKTVPPMQRGRVRALIGS